MSGCGSLVNCTDLYTPRTIKVLPDIVGIGVLTSFLVTAAAAFGAIIVGYFTDTLPSNYLNLADFIFLDTWMWCKRCRARRKLSVGIRSPLDERCKHSDPAVHDKKWRGLTTFTLSLSDQQLVTGLAIMIAALSQRCTISSYELQVVNSLAWLASSTHLTTMLVLKEYFQHNRVVRNIRVVGMVVNLVLLLYMTLMDGASYYADNSAPIQCILGDRYILWTSLSFNNVLSILILLQQYCHSIFHLYATPSDIKHWVLRPILHAYCCTWSSTHKFSEEEFENWYEAAIVQNDERPRSTAKLESLFHKEIVLPGGITNRLKYHLRLAHSTWCIYDASFLSNIPNVILYNAAYSVTETFSVRQSKPQIVGSENSVDFGQIVPLFLLWLPVLAIIESYFDVLTQDRQENRNKWSNSMYNPKASKALAQKTSTEMTLLSASKTALENCSLIATAPNGTNSQALQRLDINSEVDVSGKTTETSQHDSDSPTVFRRNGTGVAATAAMVPNLPIINPHTETYMRRLLNVIFLALAANFLLLGIALWLFPVYTYVWMFGLGCWALWYLCEESIFIFRVMKKLRLTKKEDIKPPRGFQAPPPSPIDVLSVNQSLSLVEEPLDIADLERDFEAPRRRRTYELFDQFGEDISSSRCLIRSDTEANIGIQN